MRLLAVLLLVAPPALAATHHPSPPAHKRPARQAPHAVATNAPKSDGVFGDWQAATHQEAGQLVCYAFTRAKPARGSGEAILTVAERPGSRDAVAISASTPYPRNAAVTVKVETTILPFYTAGRSAFARDGKAAVTAFQRGREAVAHAPGAKGEISDSFSLRGFSAAYAAVLKACPAR